MKFKENIGWLYTMAPYLLRVVDNKLSFSLDVLLKNNYKLKLKNGDILKAKSSQLYNIFCLLGALCFATSYSVRNSNIEICNDLMNKFNINFNNLTVEDHNLLELLFWGPRFGANFVSGNNDIHNYREKTFKIYKENNKKIIETSNGVKFYLDSINTNNTIIDTFVRHMHFLNTHIDWKNKIVIDAGAECGDTPLYYASKGATVYAFEPIKDHYDAMMRNLSLNPELSKRIIPINAAIGKDEKLNFFRDSKATGMGYTTSFVYNYFGKDASIFAVQGYSLESAIKKFNIDHVDLLKADCKGCEFFFTEQSLEKIYRVKIEYTARGQNKVEDLLKLLQESGFDCIMYRDNFQSRNPSSIVGYIYGTKINDVKNNPHEITC